MSDSGYLTPRDLALLKEAFDETCANNEMARNSPAATKLAKELVAAFESGIHDKRGLLAVAKRGSWHA